MTMNINIQFAEELIVVENLFQFLQLTMNPYKQV